MIVWRLVQGRCLSRCHALLQRRLALEEDRFRAAKRRKQTACGSISQPRAVSQAQPS